MSRIAGVATAPGGPDALVELLGGMLSASLAGARDPSWAEPYVAAGDGAALGWCGGGRANLLARDRLLCCVSGSAYNRPELGAEESDAALVARLYDAHGFAGALERLNGDFAIALYDGASHTLWLGRDRLGVRPLYYVASDERFAFSSRPVALLGLPGVSRAIDRRFAGLFAGSHYRYFDNDQDSSPYAAISQLPAAHLLRVREGEPVKSRWWSLEDQPDLDDAPEALAERYRDLLLDAVAIRVRSAQRPAFTLSGGMDSSTVVASAVSAAGAKQHAFSTLYAGSEYDESEEIRSMLDAAVERWHPITVDRPDVLGLVAEMIEAHDEPVATATWLSHFVLCRAVADEGFDTLFGGLGGDELNAGEYEYFLYRFADLRSSGQEELLSEEVISWKRHHDHPIFRKDFDVMESGLVRFTDLSQPGRIVSDRARLERYAAAVNPDFFDLRAYQPVMDRPYRSYLKNRTYQDLFRETAPCCLRAEDRQTAAFGMRNCDPFFDHRLVELMFRVPGELKIRDGVTKRLLREATRGLLPEETRTRIKKTGWNAPADDWFSGPGREMLLELTSDGPFRDRGIYDLDEVRRLIDEHDRIVSSGAVVENHMMFLWQLVNLELWLRWLDAL